MALRAATGVADTAQRVVVEGVELAVSRTGRGPAVVCLHAIGHGGGDYAAFESRVGDRFEIVRIDWPGHGRSGSDALPASAERYAQLLAGVLRALELHRPILIGNSIGGAAALLHAQRHPVRALVLCDSGGLVPLSMMTRLFCGAFARFFEAGARGSRWFAAAFAFYYRRVVLPGAAAGPQREHIIASGYELSPILAQAWRSFAVPSADLRAVAASLTVPVWVAWARSDRVIPLWMCRPALRRLRRLTRISTYACGHSAFLEQPDAFAQDFCAFADGLQPE